MSDRPKLNYPLGEPADRLEKALTHLEKSKREAAEWAAQHAPQLERLKALQERLDSLPQYERRKVLDAIGQKHVSAVPKPLEPVRASGYMPRATVPAEPPAVVNWRLWVNMPQVQLWEAVALVLGIEPGSLKHSESGWMAGPGRGPFFDLRSFPSPEKSKEFDDALLLADRAANYDGPPIYIGLPDQNKRTAMVLLPDVVAFFAACNWPDIPAPLLAIMKPTAAAALSAPATPPAPASEQGEATNDRRARRYKLCVDAGLEMPTDDYARLPRGIGALAKCEGITRQALAEDLKAHIRHLNSR